jgi:hypothetical protein
MRLRESLGLNAAPIDAEPEVASLQSLLETP